MALRVPVFWAVSSSSGSASGRDCLWVDQDSSERRSRIFSNWTMSL